MATAILTNDMGYTKAFGSKMQCLNKKKEFSMMKRTPYIHDVVSAKERLSVPFSYRWLKFKTKLFGLAMMKGSPK